MMKWIRSLLGLELWPEVDVYIDLDVPEAAVREERPISFTSWDGEILKVTVPDAARTGFFLRLPGKGRRAGLTIGDLYVVVTRVP